ncbi:uncharacterized protein LOC144288674 [Canis aureus]
MYNLDNHTWKSRSECCSPEKQELCCCTFGGSIPCTLLSFDIFHLCNFGDFPEQNVDINLISSAPWYFRLQNIRDAVVMKPRRRADITQRRRSSSAGAARPLG